MYKKLFIFLAVVILAIVAIVLYKKISSTKPLIKTLPGNLVFPLEVLEQGKVIIPTGTPKPNDYTLDWNYYSFTIPSDPFLAKSENLSIGNIIHHDEAGILANSDKKLYYATYLNVLKDNNLVQTKFGSNVKDYPDLDPPILYDSYRYPRFFYIYDILKTALNTSDVNKMARQVKKIVITVKSRDKRSLPVAESMTPGSNKDEYNELDVNVITI